MSLDSSFSSRRTLILAATLLMAGALLRLAALAHPPPVNIDEVRYLLTAHHVAVGLGYCDWRGPETHIHPAHPLLTSALAGSRRELLESRGRLVTLVSSVLLLAPLTCIAYRLGGPSSAIVALAFLALHPALVRSAATVEPEGLSVLAIGLALLLLLPIIDESLPLWRWSAAGVLFGGAYLARPEGIPVGVLAGLTALLLARAQDQHRSMAGLGIFLAALLVTASPFLLFIHRVTGEWGLTGKTLELFFIGQGLRETGGAPPDYLRLRELERQWNGVLPFLRANPRAVLQTAAMNARGIFGRILPSQLGAFHLAGLLAFLMALPGHAKRLRQSLLILTPCLTLLLMLLTFPNARVAGSVLPFLLILSAAGWMHWVDTLISSVRLRAGLTLAILALGGLLAWSRTPGQNPTGLGWGAVSPERAAAQRALERAGDSRRIASNDPVLSFYAGEPDLFGPPGIYTPLPGTACCEALQAILMDREATVAILSGRSSGSCTDFASQACSLRPIFEARRRGGEPLRVLALEPDTGEARP